MQDPQPDRIWYLPHHPVENINKPGKVRRVANAAPKFRGQLLNSNLLTGPDLLRNLLGVLMRFQEHPVAVQEHQVVRLRAQYTFLTIVPKRTVNNYQKSSKPSESTFKWMTTSNYMQQKKTLVRQFLKQNIACKQVGSDSQNLFQAALWSSTKSLKEKKTT